MSFFNLRRVLLVDAATCIAAGLLMMLGARLLDELLGLPAALLQYAGVSLLAFTAFLVYVGTRKTLSRTAVWVVIAVNALWAADSFLLLLTGWIAPTGLGYAFVIAQALAVALLADVQYLGLRRSFARAA
jgi:hypothetical protein